jgi:hypothetical protein
VQGASYGKMFSRTFLCNHNLHGVWFVHGFWTAL